MATDDRAAAPAPSPHEVQCGVCGRSTDCTPADLLRFARDGWPRCCGEVMFLLADPVPPTPAPDVTPLDLPGRRVRPFKVGVSLRLGPTGGGPDLAVGLMDVSAGGIGVRVLAEVEAGQEVVVELTPARAAEAVRRAADVRWCLAAGDGTFLAGFQFRRPLTAGELAGLVR